MWLHWNFPPFPQYFSVDLVDLQMSLDSKLCGDSKKSFSFYLVSVPIPRLFGGRGGCYWYWTQGKPYSQPILTFDFETRSPWVAEPGLELVNLPAWEPLLGLQVWTTTPSTILLFFCFFNSYWIHLSSAFFPLPLTFSYLCLLIFIIWEIEI